MTARVAPFFPATATGDGTTKTFALGFPIIAAENVRVIQNGVLKVLGTDYAIVEATSLTPSVRFFTAPTNGHALKFYRNTPIGLPLLNPEVSHVEARIAKYRQEERDDAIRSTSFILPIATLITAPTAQTFVAPCDGYITGMESTVEQAVTTGGTLTLAIDGVTVTGATQTIANSAAVGLKTTSTPTTSQASYTKVYKGQTVSVTPASFATAGALSGEVRIQPADLS